MSAQIFCHKKYHQKWALKQGALGLRYTISRRKRGIVMRCNSGFECKDIAVWQRLTESKQEESGLDVFVMAVAADNPRMSRMLLWVNEYISIQSHLKFAVLFGAWHESNFLPSTAPVCFLRITIFVMTASAWYLFPCVVCLFLFIVAVTLMHTSLNAVHW